MKTWLADITLIPSVPVPKPLIDKLCKRTVFAVSEAAVMLIMIPFVLPASIVPKGPVPSIVIDFEIMTVP